MHIFLPKEKNNKVFNNILNTNIREHVNRLQHHFVIHLLLQDARSLNTIKSKLNGEAIEVTSTKSGEKSFVDQEQ